MTALFLHIISGGIPSHVSLARSLNSFVLPIREVDVDYAPLLGRLCALLVYIPVDYQLSFSRFILKSFENHSISSITWIYAYFC